MININILYQNVGVSIIKRNWLTMHKCVFNYVYLVLTSISENNSNQSL